MRTLFKILSQASSLFGRLDSCVLLVLSSEGEVNGIALICCALYHLEHQNYLKFGNIQKHCAFQRERFTVLVHATKFFKLNNISDSEATLHQSAGWIVSLKHLMDWVNNNIAKPFGSYLPER